MKNKKLAKILTATLLAVTLMATSTGVTTFAETVSENKMGDEVVVEDNSESHDELEIEAYVEERDTVPGTSIDYTISGYSDLGLTLTLVGNMETMPDMPLSTYPWYPYHNDITRVLISKVTHIGNHAFSGYKKLNFVLFGSGVSSVGTCAFYESGIKEIVINSTEKMSFGDCAFENCDELESFTFPENVETIGDQCFYKCDKLKNIQFESELINVKGLKNIGNHAFGSCPALKEVTLPGTLKTIGTNIFSSCENLETVKVEKGARLILSNYMFEGCTALKNFDFSGVKEIGFGTFRNCPGFVSVDLGNVEMMKDYAFDKCTALVKVILPKKSLAVSAGSGYAFRGCPNIREVYVPGGCLSVPDSIFEIGSIEKVTFESGVSTLGNAFSGSKITSIELPNTLTTIGNNAFYRCKNLTSVSIPNAVTTIGEYAFAECSLLESVQFGNRVNTLGASAFRSCAKLNNLTIPGTVYNIGEYCFAYCTGLENVALNEGIVNINNYAFMNCTSLKEMIFPESVTKMNEGIVNGCTSLSRVKLGSNVTSVGDSLFYGCSSLKSVAIPDGVEALGASFFSNSGVETVHWSKNMRDIGAWTFTDDTSIKTLVLPEKTTAIYAYMVQGCTSLTNIILNDGLTTIKERSIYQCPAVTSIIIPDSVTTIETNGIDASITIYGKTGSEAERYANANGNTFISSDKQYTLKFNGNGNTSGLVPATKSLKLSDTYTIPTASLTKSGCQFMGWNTKADGTGAHFADGAKVTGLTTGTSVTLYAEWKVNQYTVEFYGNGATAGSMSSVKYNAATSYSLPANKYTLTGFEFIGWNTQPGGTGVSFADKATVKDLTKTDGGVVKLYAQWKKSTNPPEKPGSEDAEKQIRAFVSRMYTVALGRPAETAGLNDWAGQLINHTNDGAGLARGFICSAEFTNKKLGNEAYLDTLYKTFFDRAADAGGKAYWMNQLNSGASRNAVLAGFVNSQEFASLCDKYGIARGTLEADGSSIYNAGVRNFVLRMYTKCLKRQGETVGVEDWAHRINKKQMTPEAVAKSFFNSAEFVNKKLSNEDYVETLYQTFMDRASDPAGKADWVNKLNSGTSRQVVLEGFSRSSEFAKIMKDFGL